MKWITTLFTVFSILLNATAYTQVAPDHWEQLKPGTSHVGFTAVYAYDHARAGLKADMPARRIKISFWYPALKSKGRNMKVNDFLEESLINRPGGKASQTSMDSMYRSQIQQLGRVAALPDNELDKIKNLSCLSEKNAPPAKGKYPLIVFPGSFIPADNIILAEYLASHGYVVASFNLQGTEDPGYEISIRGLETLAADMMTVINKACDYSYVDADKITAMGVGFNGTAGFLLRMHNAKIKSLVSLDGGILTQFEQNMIAKSSYYNPFLIKIPVLYIYAPHPSVSPENASGLKYGERYFAHFPKMSEFHFLDYGKLEKISKDILGKAPGNTNLGVDWSYQTILHFLNWTLKNDTKGRDWLDAEKPAELILMEKKMPG